MNDVQTDVLVVGSGPAGSTLAYLLAKAGRDVTLVDRHVFPRDKTCGDGLTPRAIWALQRLDLDISEMPTAAVDSALLVAPGGTQAHFSFRKLLAPSATAAIIPRLIFDEWLHKKAVAAGAKYVHGTVESVSMEGKMATGVHLRKQGSIRANLTVIATGANTALLKQMGVMQKMRDPIVAIRTYFDGVENKGSFEFFFEKDLLPGYGWVFPLPNGRANVGIGVFGESLRNERPPINALFDKFLALPRIQQRLAGASETGPRRSHPLRDDFPLHDITGDGWLIAGESAGIVHPVTGEGIDLAIESAEMAAEVILAKKSGFAWSASALAPYDRKMNRTFKRTFQGARMLQRYAITEKMFDRVVRRAATYEDFARIALRINLGLATPLAILQPKVMWTILYPKLMGYVAPVFAKSR